MKQTFIVAIDGPNGSGKSTVAKKVADILGIIYIDTGAMYRALGYYFTKNSIEMTDENAILHMKKPKLELDFKSGKAVVILDGEDISDKIRTPEIAMAASNISKLLPIREYLVELQRNMAKGSSVVMEGRDIGSVVFPNADVKIYLTADLEKRAERRLKDYELGGKKLSKDEVMRDIEKRDYQDMHRENSPLIQVEDAVLIDTTSLTLDEVVGKVIEIIKER